MESLESLPKWIALTVKPQHEKSAQRYLTECGIEAYLPLHKVRRRWSDRTKILDVPLFPRYVFCRSAFENRLTVLRAPGVQAIVGFGGVPAAIPASEIEAIKRLIASRAPLASWPYLCVGERASICAGPLAGLEGIVVREKSARRVVISVNVLMRSVAVEVEEHLLEPARSSIYAYPLSSQATTPFGRM